MVKFKISAQEYRDFLTGIEIRALYLKKLNTELVNEGVDFNREVSVDLSTRASYENTEDNIIRIKQIYRIKISDKETDEPLVNFNSTFVLVYYSERPMDKDVWEVFKRRNVPLNIWPYVRELFDSSTRRFGLPPYLLPMITVYK